MAASRCEDAVGSSPLVVPIAASPVAFDRRRFTVGAMVALTAACTPSRQSKADTREAQSLWELFAARFVDPSGRVVDTGNGQISHTEGQGYGMLFALFAQDRPAFELIWDWTNRTLARSDIALHAWRFDPHGQVAVADHNNATDGDILIAWSLAGAAQRWKVREWADRSAAIRSAIRARLVVQRHGYNLLIPGLDGFVTPQKVLINPAYFIWPALDGFAALDGKAVWGPVADDCARLVTAARFGPNQLPTDWLEVTGPGEIAPAQGREPRFGFDAVRVPLHAVAGKRAEVVAPIANYWRSFRQRQQPIPAWTDVITGDVAPYPLSDGGETIANRLIGGTVPDKLSNDYYAAALQLLARAMR